MKNLLIALVIGTVAGLIDIIPMVKQKINKFSIASIFVQWVLIGLVIPFISWDIQPWLKGIVIAELGMLPFMIQAYFRNQKAVPTIAIFAAISGIAIAIATNIFIK